MPAPPVDPLPATAYVVSYGSGTVTAIRTVTNTALTAIKVGSQPVAIAITPPETREHWAGGPVGAFDLGGHYSLRPPMFRDPGAEGGRPASASRM